MHQEDTYKGIDLLLKASTIIADRESLPPPNSSWKKSRRRHIGPEELKSYTSSLTAEQVLQRQQAKLERRAAEIKRYTNLYHIHRINRHDEKIERLNSTLKSIKFALEDAQTQLRYTDNYLKIADREVDSSENNLKTNQTPMNELITELASKRAELKKSLKDINDVRSGKQVATPKKQPEAEEKQQEEEKVADKERQPKQKKRKVSKPQNIEELPKFVVPFIDKDGERRMTIGAKKSSVPRELFDKLDWDSVPRATRGLLTYFFDRKVLGTHCYSGKKSPIYAKTDKAPKARLNTDITHDIIYIVSKMCKVGEREVVSNITSKCADESKLWKKQEAKKKKSTPAGASSSSKNT